MIPHVWEVSCPQVGLEMSTVLPRTTGTGLFAHPHEDCMAAAASIPPYGMGVSDLEGMRRRGRLYHTLSGGGAPCVLPKTI